MATTNDISPPSKDLGANAQPIRRTLPPETVPVVSDINAPRAPLPQPSPQRPSVDTQAVQDALSNQLQSQQNARSTFVRNDQRSIRESQRFARPARKLIYYPLITLAIIADVVGLLDLTGIGAAIVFIIDIGMSAFFFGVSLWLNRNIKKARLSGERISAVIRNVEQRAQLYRQRTTTILQYMRKSAAGKSILRSTLGRRAVGASAKLAKWTRMPMVRSVGAYILELIPLINILPWYTINMVLTYREHQREYTLSQEASSEYPTVAQEERATFQSFQEAQVIQTVEAIQQL